VVPPLGTRRGAATVTTPAIVVHFGQDEREAQERAAAREARSPAELVHDVLVPWLWDRDQS
jgi:hypothetical protein